MPVAATESTIMGMGKRTSQVLLLWIVSSVSLRFWDAITILS